MPIIDRIPTIRFTDLARRSFLRRAGGVGLSAAAVGLLANCGPGYSRAANAEMASGDIDILNTAISAEHEAIAAYQVGAESGLLSPSVLDLAVQFQGHHKEHADILSKTIATLGGHPNEPQPSYAFPVEDLKTEADVLVFAAGLEQGAVSAYLGAVPLFENRDLSQAAASILGDEAMHWAVLRYVLGQNPVPSAFVS